MTIPYHKLFFIFIFITLSSSINAQSVNSETSKKNLIQLSIVPLGVSFERELSQSMTATVGLNNWSLYQSFEVITSNLDVKYYYNAKKRRAKGRKCSKFSSDYVSLYFDYTLTDQTTRTKGNTTSYSPRFAISPTWGMQRSFLKYFYLKFNLGFGVYYYEKSTDPTPEFLSDTWRIDPTIRFNLGLNLLYF